MRKSSESENGLRVSPRIQAVLFLLALALLSTLVVAETPGNTRLWAEIFNAGHAPLFGVVAVITLILSANILRSHFKHHMDHYIFSLFSCAVFGVVTELIQGQIGRDADPYDVLRDVAGAAAFLLAMATLDPAFKTRRLFSRLIARLSLRIVAALILVSTSTSAIIWCAAYFERDRRFPVLCEYDSYLSNLFLIPEYAAVSAVNPPQGWVGDPVSKIGKLTFDLSTYPGLTFNEPYPDWTGYSFMSFDVFSPLGNSARLSVRVHDIHHNWDINDRFTKTFEIEPGINHISISMEDIRNAPVGRKMDMAAIRQIIIFTDSPAEPFSLYISPLKLQ
jgi:hypothetical protein